MTDSDFGAYLCDLWMRAGMNQREFAHAVRRRENYISRVRLGQLLPPKDDVIYHWGETIGASNYECQRLLDLAALANTPERIRRKFIQLSLAAAV